LVTVLVFTVLAKLAGENHLRGTIPTGQSRGVYVLAAFLPDEGWVMLPVEVRSFVPL